MELKLCDILLFLVTGPLMPIMFLIIIVALVLAVLTDEATNSLCSRLPRFRCPVVWRRK